MADDAAAVGTEGGFTFKLYRYTPSLTAAIIFVVIFAVLSAVHTWRLLRYRAYYFTAFTIGGYCKDKLRLDCYRMHLRSKVANVKALQFNWSAMPDASGPTTNQMLSEVSLCKPF